MRGDKELEEKAAAMFASGSKVNQVAAALCKKNWAKAKKLHAAWLAQQGGAIEVAGTEAEDSEAWEVTLRLPAAQIDALFLTFTPQEKADAVCGVMQARINAIGI